MTPGGGAFGDGAFGEEGAGPTAPGLDTAVGSYVITGAAAGIIADRILGTAVGLYTITGFPASLTIEPAGTWHVFINGVEVSVRLDGGATIRQVLKVRSVATFHLVGSVTTPSFGDFVRIRISGCPEDDFRGSIVSVVQTYDEAPANTAWQVTCIAQTLLNKRKPLASYSAVSASTVVGHLIDDWTTGYTHTGVQLGLPAVTVVWDGTKSVYEQLVALCVLAGCQFYFQDDDLHFFQTETPAHAPSDLDSVNPYTQNVPAMAQTSDGTQLVTRILVEGDGSKTAAACAVGDTVIPISDSTRFASGGGTAKTGTQKITYTSKQAGGGQVTVTGDPSLNGGSVSVAQPSPLVAGQVSGAVSYKVSFGTANGDAIPTGGGTSVTVTTLANGSSGSDGTLAPTGGSGGLSVGSYAYVLMMVTDTGQKNSGEFNSTFNISSSAVSFKPIKIGFGYTDPRVKRLDLYRSLVNATSGPYYFVASFTPGLAVQNYTDSIPDSALGSRSLTSAAVAVDTGSNGNVLLSSISTSGDARVISRTIWRTKAGGSIYYQLVVIGNNTDTTYTDNTPDSSLGDVVPANSTVAIPAGNTTINVDQLANVPSSGFVLVNSTAVRYTGRSASSGAGQLTGVPSVGAGSITAAISSRTVLTGSPSLTGVPSGGAGSIVTALLQGDNLYIFSQVDDAAAQAAIGALMKDANGNPTDGIIEYAMIDRSLQSVAACTAAGQARLTLYKTLAEVLTWPTRDPNVRAGRMIHVNQTPEGFTGDLMIQEVNIIKEDAIGALPLRRATAASVWRTVEDLLLRI